MERACAPGLEPISQKVTHAATVSSSETTLSQRMLRRRQNARRAGTGKSDDRNSAAKIAPPTRSTIRARPYVVIKGPRAVKILGSSAVAESSGIALRAKMMRISQVRRHISRGGMRERAMTEQM